MGVGSRSYRRRAAARVARAEVAAELARLEAEVARSYHAAVRYRLEAELEHSLLVTASDYMQATRRLLEVAARDPLDLLGAEVEVARQERAASVARAGRWPTVSLNGGYNRSTGLEGDNALWQLNPRNASNPGRAARSIPRGSRT